MKKKFTAVTALMLAAGFMLGSCGGSGSKDSQGGNSTPPTSSGSGNNSGIEFDLDGFNAEHYPDMANIKQQEGKIDVAKLRPITYDASNHKYVVLGEAVGNAFSDGNKLK